jgi:hypothetical protein
LVPHAGGQQFPDSLMAQVGFADTAHADQGKCLPRNGLQIEFSAGQCDSASLHCGTDRATGSQPVIANDGQKKEYRLTWRTL